MYQEFNGFYDALDDLVSFTTGQRITTSQADKLQQAIRSLDGPSFETEEIQKQVESPQFLQAIQQGLIPYITPQELQSPEVSESCNEAVDSFLVDEDGDIEDPSFNLNTFGKNQVTESAKDFEEFGNAEDVEKRLGELNYLKTQRDLTPEEEEEFIYCQNLIGNK